MNKQCPICSWNKAKRWWNRHMVEAHGWRYYDGISVSPPKESTDG